MSLMKKKNALNISMSLIEKNNVLSISTFLIKIIKDIFPYLKAFIKNIDLEHVHSTYYSVLYLPAAFWLFFSLLSRTLDMCLLSISIKYAYHTSKMLILLKTLEEDCS